MLLITGGTVIDPATGVNEKKDLAVKDGKIRELSAPGALSALAALPGCQTIDATGCVVAPGLVDPHVHFRDPGQTHKEDIVTGAASAAKGGYTSVIMMGNTVPHPDTPETVRYMIDQGKKTPIRVYACGNVTMEMKGKTLTDMKALKAAGAVLFTDDGLPLRDADLMRRACEQAASLHMMISLHEEDPKYVKEPGINAGVVAKEMGLTGASREAEISMVKRDIGIARETGCSITVQHISAAETVELIRQARREGLSVHGEASPHHFSLTEDAVRKHGTNAKMNPPLRTEEDRLAIIEGLRDGTIEMIATDHAPHAPAEKARPFTEAPSGIIGLETALSLGIRTLVQTGCLSLENLLKCMSTNPATITGISGGSLKIGAPADIVVFDPDEIRVAGDYRSKSENTPFTGEKMPGVVHATVCAGRIAYEKKKQVQ